MFLRYGITSEDDKSKALRDAESFIRLDRAAREVLTSRRELGVPYDSPAAKKADKNTDKNQKGVRPVRPNPFIFMVAGEGFEPPTFGL
jgi:hypothetical protein